MQRDDAWLLDLYPARDRMVLWFITAEGERLRLTRHFAPSFYVEGIEKELGARETRGFFDAIEKSPTFENAGVAARRDFWSNELKNVQEIRVANLDAFKLDLLQLADRYPDLTYYNCDIPPEIMFCYDTGIFPTAHCTIFHEQNYLDHFELMDDPLATEYELPPLRGVKIRAEGNFLGKRPRLHSLTIEEDGRSATWDEGDTEEIIASFRHHLNRIDPDVIWSDGGDTYLFKALFQIAQQRKLPLGLDRDETTERRLDYDGHTYVSYGQVLYHAPDYPLYGRLHFDSENSFWLGHCRLEGLVEVARMAKIPLQRAARRSIGTGISSIQLDWAYRRGYLIPWRKAQHEAWKSAWQFMQADRGGLVYQPIVGTYEDVWELDFVSMYPTIMVHENVSPETINCRCCPPSADVPDLNYTLCKKRSGVTAETLRPIIEKRNYFKAQRKKAKARGDDEAYARYDHRQDSLKWLLVCCFGYLGYRNARFGRIEAHESTCAFSREKLIRAKEICEARGFRVLHAIVDSFWIQRAGATREEIQALSDEINRATNLTIGIEGRYAWIAFLPSRQNPDIPVPNRYFGVFEDGSLKFRGIETRRGDQAPFVRKFQRRLLDRLGSLATLPECRAAKEELVQWVRDAAAAIRCGDVAIEDLLLSRGTSKAAEEYKNNNMTAVAARQAKKAGLNLHAGEEVRFLIIHQKDRDPDSRLRVAALLQAEDHYDVEFYAEQVRRAAATVLEPVLHEPLADLLEEKEVKKSRSGSRSRRPRYSGSFFGDPAIFPIDD